MASIEERIKALSPEQKESFEQCMKVGDLVIAFDADYTILSKYYEAFTKMPSCGCPDEMAIITKFNSILDFMNMGRMMMNDLFIKMREKKLAELEKE